MATPMRLRSLICFELSRVGVARLSAPLKNECVKAPGMTAPDGRGSVVKSTVFQSRDLRERSAALVGL